MFFENEREHFFRPLTGKYRAQVVECLTELYRRFFSASSADYGQALQRDQLLEIFQETLVRNPLSSASTGLDSETSESDDAAARPTREQAVWLMNLLLEHGWLEKQLDQATLHSSFAFSRYGREFTEPFVASARPLARTRHRNTRNTRNSLESFLERGDVYDLIDAFEYSERIISDFTDVIGELEERKRELVSEMEDQLLIEHASDAFFDFMEKRFQPDLAVRLSADNVERHRDQIETLLRAIRRKDRTFKTEAERQLRHLLPDQVEEGKSLLWWMLDGIEQRLNNAAEIMLPALRKALQGFTKRADIIIRQMSYLSSQHKNTVVDVCKTLADLSSDQQDQALLKAGELMGMPELGFVDPEQVKLAAPRQRQKPVALLSDSHHQPLDENARKAQYLQTLLDQAFLVNQQALKEYIERHLNQGQTLSSRDLPIESASDFLAVAHAIGLGASDRQGDEFRIQVAYETDPSQPADNKQSDGYFQRKDHFLFQLITPGSTSHHSIAQSASGQLIEPE